MKICKEFWKFSHRIVARVHEESPSLEKFQIVIEEVKKDFPDILDTDIKIGNFTLENKSTSPGVYFDRDCTKRNIPNDYVRKEI